MNDSPTRTDAGRRRIDVNADLGEGCPNDRGLLGLVTSASVCCGAHAGDPAVIRQTLTWALERDVMVGAHPGYPDREHFGRRDWELPADAVTSLVLDQVADLLEQAARVGIAVRFLKPHGALYNQAQRQEPIARGVVEAAVELRLPLLGQPGTFLQSLAGGRGVRYLCEAFPDRRYREDGSLVPRGEPGAVLHDPAEMEDQLARLIADPRVATLCIHGDDPRALENARMVRRALEERGVLVRAFAGDV